MNLSSDEMNLSECKLNNNSWKLDNIPSLKDGETIEQYITDYTFISNTCLATDMYHGTYRNRYKNKKIYNNPIIAYLIPDDYQYVKFCKNFDYYMSLEPILKSPNNNSIWSIHNKGVWYRHEAVKTPYNVLHLEDIELHCFHESNASILLDKYKRRQERYLIDKPKPIFMLSQSELFLDHNQEDYDHLIKDFMSIPRSFYLTKYAKDLDVSDRCIYVDEWKNTKNLRDLNGMYYYDHLLYLSERFIPKMLEYYKLNKL